MRIDLLTLKSLSMVKYVATCLNTQKLECGMTLLVGILSKENKSKFKHQQTHISTLQKLRFMDTSKKVPWETTIWKKASVEWPMM